MAMVGTARMIPSRPKSLPPMSRPRKTELSQSSHHGEADIESSEPDSTLSNQLLKRIEADLYSRGINLQSSSAFVGSNSTDPYPVRPERLATMATNSAGLMGFGTCIWKPD